MGRFDREERKGIEGLPDTYNPMTGTGAQVAQTQEEADELYAQLPRGSRADQQRLIAERREDDDDE